MIRSSLNDREAIANTRMGAREEREQVAKDTRERSNGFRDSFPTFRPARMVSLAEHLPVDDAYLNSSASSPHNDFNLCMERIGMRTTSPFCSLRVSVTPCKLDQVCDSIYYALNFMSRNPVSVDVRLAYSNHGVFFGDSVCL
jgi:hypothetical protein